MKKSKDIISLIDIVSDLEQLQKKVKEEIISLQSDKGLMQNDLEHYNKQLLITENNLKAKQENFDLLDTSISLVNAEIANKKYNERYKAKQRFENN
mgnify:CR=1 FL=1